MYIELTYFHSHYFSSLSNPEETGFPGESRQVRLADFEIDRNPAQVGATGASRRTVSTIPRWYS